MAKSKSFFGLRTGSTKSLTFQVYRGQQVTKDRVYRVSNPRTEGQMTQRALIPIVAAARSALKGLVDHSFEGVAYGEASLREFSKQNLRAGALSVTSYSPNGVSNPGFADLIVSNGSIHVPFNITSTTTGNSVKTSSTPYPPFKLPAVEKGASADAIFKYLESYARDFNVPLIAPGTQLTFLTIYQSGSVMVNTGTGTIEAPTSGFILDRIYIPNGDSDSENAKEINDKWKVSATVSQDAKSVVLENSNGNKLTISCEGSLSLKSEPNETATNDNNCGMALILSRYVNGVWKRSPSRLTIGFEPTNIYSFEDWLSTYKTTGAASKKYLNTGDESTGIQG
ncbi:hypothetical protein K0B57_22550 [Salmonella enterica subsp. enterica serovar Montevideo]|nr:hypothetical protein [Salmonella enterica subsp. enterica serovar Montevideo]MCR3573686.1 hypothetical protein [Salmonella enterica subsp. enterica serovar Give]